MPVECILSWIRHVIHVELNAVGWVTVSSSDH